MIVRTKNGNKYYLSNQMKDILILSPILNKIIENDGDVDKITSLGLDKVAIAYYKQKYDLLKEAGYFISPKNKGFEIITRELLEKAIANSGHIVFETTEACNLKCKYCGYGDIYSTFEERKKSELSFDKARIFLDFMLNKWNSCLNASFGKRITISFYGGEPLMNFYFIENVVNYVCKCKLESNYIDFSITTNGTLLDKYIDFLVKWNFNLFISLDGDKRHNSFRVYLNEKESFDKVFHNIVYIKNKYPKYFKEKVFFNSVFHKKSSFVEVSNFFQFNFNKLPLFLSLNTFGVAVGKELEFEKLYKNPVDTLNIESECNPEIKERFSSINDKLISFVNHYSNNLFSEYNLLRFDIDNARLPTGTCVPFQNRIYISTNGNILPCEKVGSDFVMGKIFDDKVEIYYEDIIDFYNQKFEKIVYELCSKCKNLFCRSCMFTMKDRNGKLSCGKYLDEKGFENYIASLMKEFEDNPMIVANFIKSLNKAD